MKKKHKKRVRVLAVDPVVSDPTVLAKLDKERKQVETQRPRHFNGYGIDDYLDPTLAMASMVALSSALNRRVRKRKQVIENVAEELK